MEKFLLLGLILGALALFASERVRADLVALGLLLVLLLSGQLTVQEGFTGFASPAVITVICMFMLSGALVRTGVADALAGLVMRSGLRGRAGLTFGVMLLVGSMSAFMNNIAAVAILLPSVFAIAQRSRLPVTKLLMPLSFGSLLGGLTTLVGTPPNLLAAEALNQAGYAPFRMFDFMPTGLSVLVVGMVYLVVLGGRLIPERTPAAAPEENAALRRYVTEVNIPRGSSLVGKTLPKARLKETLGVSVLRVHRRYNEARGERAEDRPWMAHGRYGRDEGEGWYSFVPWPETALQAEDHLQLEGDPSALLQRQGSGLFEILSESGAGNGDGESQLIGEVALAPSSHSLGIALEDAAFPQRYGVTVVGLRRSGRQQAERLNQMRLETGDVLLVRGTAAALSELAHNADFLVVNRLDHAERDYARRWIAVAIMATTVLAAATGLLHISVAALAGVLTMVAAGCLPVRDLYTQVDWRVIFMIAAMMPLGIAMDDAHTGAGRWMAEGLLVLAGGSNPTLALLLVVLLTIGLTQLMSNAACVVLIAPIAIAIAENLGVSPYPFAMAVAIAASTSFLTPIGHQANVLVYGVGNYRFGDFVRVGGPLTALILIVVLTVVPAVWPFY
jgi:di/tricarboxylate transporter